MAEVINTNVFDAEKKFVDFAGLDYFWEKAKAYVDGADKVTADKVAILEGVVGDNASGLVQKVNLIQGELDGLNGGAGSITTQITNALAALDVEDAAVEGQYVSSVAEVDGKVVVTRANLPVYEEVGVAAGLNNAMDERVKVLEAIDHEKLAADASAAAVATVLDGAPEKFDTLKEVAQWISDSESAATAADLVTRVGALEAIDHEAYVGADETVLSTAKSYADGLVMTDGVAKFDAAGAAATAKAEAIADAESKYQPKGNYEAAGTTEAAIAALDLPNTYEAKGAAADAQAAAIAQAKLDAAEALKAYYTKTEVDNLLSTNSTGDRAYAKQYTDELFNSIQFAANSDIDALFAPKTEA